MRNIKGTPQQVLKGQEGRRNNEQAHQHVTLSRERKQAKDHFQTPVHHVQHGSVVNSRNYFHDVTPSPSRPSTSGSISRRRGRDNREYVRSPRNLRLRTPPRPLTSNPTTSWQDRLSTARPRTAYDIPIGRPFGDALPKNQSNAEKLTGSLKSRGYRDRVNYGRPTHPSFRDTRKPRGRGPVKVHLIRAAARIPSPSHRLKFTQTMPGGMSPLQKRNSRRLHTSSGQRRRDVGQHSHGMNQTTGARPSTAVDNTVASKRKSILRSNAVGKMVTQLQDKVRANWRYVLPALKQLSFTDNHARLEALDALLPNLSEKERSNMDHWVVNNQHRVQLLQEMVETSINEDKAPDREALRSGKTVREGYRPRAFTEYWDANKVASGVANFGGENNRAKAVPGESIDEKLFPNKNMREDIQFRHAKAEIVTPTRIFNDLKHKSQQSARTSLKTTSITSRTVVPKKGTPGYSDDKHRLKTTNMEELPHAMRPVYKYIHPGELGHNNRFTRMRNYRKFNNGLYETQKRTLHQYKNAEAKPKFIRANYDQGLNRNLYGR